MTIRTARAELERAVEEAWSAVGELVLIALEDQPAEGSLAAADDLAEQVSEIQGYLAEVRSALDRAGPSVDVTGDLPGVLPAVIAGLDGAVTRYWTRVRVHQPVAQLRAATVRLGGAWPDWWRSVEQTAARCEAPFARTAAAVQLCCQEICDLARPTPYDQLRRTS